MTQQPPVPLLAANKALDEIISIAKTHQPLDKFTYERLERAAKSSIQTNAAISYVTLGALEAVAGNEEKMDGYHKNAISLSNNAFTRENYAGSLYHVSRVKEAAEQARIAASLAADDINILKKAILITKHSGGITMATSLVETYKKLVPTDSVTFESLVKAASMQKTTGVADEEIMQLTQIAYDFLRSKQLHFVNHELIADEDDEGFLSLRIGLNLANEEIWNLNRQLFEIMLDQVPTQSPHLSVRFGRSHAA